MEKQKIKINYEGSGVKTLRGFSTFFMVVGIVSAVVAVISGFMYVIDRGSSSEEISLMSYFFSATIGSFVSAAVCKGLATIAETALFKKTLLKEQYKFIDGDSPFGIK